MEIIDVSDHEHPKATMEGLKIAWCDEHRDSIKPHTLGKRSRPLTRAELAE
jgi:hypothetical protein